MTGKVNSGEEMSVGDLFVEESIVSQQGPI